MLKHIICCQWFPLNRQDNKHNLLKNNLTFLPYFLQAKKETECSYSNIFYLNARKYPCLSVIVRLKICWLFWFYFSIYHVAGDSNPSNRDAKCWMANQLCQRDARVATFSVKMVNSRSVLHITGLTINFKISQY